MKKDPGKWLEISPQDYKGFLLLLLLLVHAVCQASKACRARKKRQKLDFLLVLLPYISVLGTGHADPNEGLHISEGSYCSYFLVKYVDDPVSIRGKLLSNQEAKFLFSPETIFSQRTSRKSALWNLIILFIPNVLGFLPNAYPSLLW